MDIAAIKAKAAEINVQYNPDGLVPFPFEQLAASLGNVRILTISTLGTISGAIYFQNDLFTIVINKDKPAVRQYFTLAHEFGHFYLHEQWLRENGDNGFVDFSYTLDSGNMLLRPNETSTAQIDLQKEREANNFAAELIMPADKVKEFWELTHDIQECADAFQVSTAAMAVRLERLSLT
jgi:Zn-dependent peptidase ImmA (M78 family)